ncbi:MAG: tRNA (cytidine(34)-2'-O)-methyltransferase [Lachnospiraceae bacterium]|nr:tRNA (cytidine(34)-2'-O)-methyltransferase [Lachnospiraceae bacterium]MBP3505832.1 tRNA (cytidine(34)-2'-O)-methyltransferase [Lachnospiraceae bacterium]
MVNIVLLEPEQGGNVGNIGRTCLAIGAKLHLIEPLGFRLTDKEIKRAGMDYWYRVDVTRYDNYADFLEKNPSAHVYMATTKSRQTYTEVQYEDNCYIMFGKESAGIPEEILLEHKKDCIRIPMLPDIRSLNLANSVAIVSYEAMRQQQFEQFQLQGQLHHYEW